MNAAGELCGERRVHGAMPIEEGNAGPARRDDDDLEVRLGAAGHIVRAGLVDDLEVRWGERGLKFGGYGARDRVGGVSRWLLTHVRASQLQAA